MKNLTQFWLNYKTTFWALVVALIQLLLQLSYIDVTTYQALLSVAVSFGFISAADADKLRKENQKPSDYSKKNILQCDLRPLFLIVFSFFIYSLIASSCTPSNIRFAKYSVRAGFDLAEDAGAFSPRTIEIKQRFLGDTIFYYNGINQYYIQKTDSSYIVSFTPSRQNLEDTTFHFIKKTLLKKE